MSKICHYWINPFFVVSVTELMLKQLYTKKSYTKVFLDCFSLSQSVLQMLNLTFWFLYAERKMYKISRRYMGVNPDPSSLPAAVASTLTFECASSFSFKNRLLEKSFSRIFQNIKFCLIQKRAVTMPLGWLTWHFICATTAWIMDSQKLCTNTRPPLKLLFCLFSLKILFSY